SATHWRVRDAPEVAVAGTAVIASARGRSSAGARELLAAAALLGHPGGALDLATDVAHRLHGAHPRDLVEVVDRRRRRCEPLERVALPGIRAGDPPVVKAPGDVEDGHQDPETEDEGSDRRDQVV